MSKNTSLLRRAQDEIEILLIKFDANVIFPIKVKYNRFIRNHNINYTILIIFIMVFIITTIFIKSK